MTSSITKSERKKATQEFEDRGRLVVFLIPRPCECDAYPFAHYHEGSQSMREYDESCRRAAEA